ncbi:MAG: hypothetical protein ACMVY4_17540 [Minwuia sp.]|uniref:hypothetical protein n=1 Tax=Minwuia sp. TaxID=2493630 RepID=UPI003A84F2EC
MALHRKWPALEALAPDIAIVAECDTRARLRARGVAIQPSRMAWTSGRAFKGLAVIAFPPYRLRVHPLHDPALAHVLPVEVSGAGLRFNVVGVWAQNASAGLRTKAEPGPFNRALDRYGHWIRSRPTLVGGDFNNHHFWDRQGHAINFEENLARCRRLGLESAYHLARRERFGLETLPTHYWRDRRIDGPTYHIDYLFFSAGWRRRFRRFGVGDFDGFCGPGLSDHAPLVADFDAGRGARRNRKPFPEWLLPVRKRSAISAAPLNGARAP